MVNGPEVFQIAHLVAEACKGKAIVAIEGPWKIDDNFVGKYVAGCQSYGKTLFLELNGYCYFRFTFGQRGTLVPCRMPTYNLKLTFDDGTCLCHIGQRPNGDLAQMETPNSVQMYTKDLPPCVCHATEEEIYNALAKCSNHQLTRVLGQWLSGVDNAMRSEILYEAKLNPRRKYESLLDDERWNLVRAVVSVATGLCNGTREYEVYHKHQTDEGLEVRAICERGNQNLYWVPTVQK